MFDMHVPVMRLTLTYFVLSKQVVVEGTLRAPGLRQRRPDDMLTRLLFFLTSTRRRRMGAVVCRRARYYFPSTATLPLRTTRKDEPEPVHEKLESLR